MPSLHQKTRGEREKSSYSLLLEVSVELVVGLIVAPILAILPLIQLQPLLGSLALLLLLTGQSCMGSLGGLTVRKLTIEA